MLGPTASRQRIQSLDGLRGIAALVVLIHHALLTLPTFSAPYYGEDTRGVATWMTFSPAHLVWAGGEAVDVFFILSGFVLVRSWKGDVSAYYLGRLIRLYVPVWGAVLLALALALAVPRDSSLARGEWMADHAVSLGPVTLIRNLTLIAPSFLNSPLWSLRWEVLFSLLLPIYVYLAVRFRRHWFLLAAVGMVVSWSGAILGIEGLRCMPIFLIGAALHSGWDAIPQMRAKSGSLVLGCALIGLTARWWPFGGLDHASAITYPLVLVSATVIVVLAAKLEWTSRCLDGALARAAGRLSFSLYLVHEPILVSVALLLPLSFAPLVLPIGVPAAVLVAWLFAQCIEMPAHRWARAASRRALRPRQCVER